MRKLILSIFTFALFVMPATAATWVAADRVSTVGKTIVTKNSLPANLTFKVVNGAADNSSVSTTNVVQVSSTELSYAGNDNEVAAVIATELGQIINGKATKDKLRSAAKTALKEKLSETNLINTAANSEFLSNKAKLGDLKEADMTGVDLMINAGYNPLAMIVVITKMPGSNIEIVMGKPANSERAMSVYNYLIYNYADKVKVGYNCQEYKNFLAYATPIDESRAKSKRAVNKFNKEQEKIKKQRAKSLNQYQQSGGLSSWDATYTILTEMAASQKK